MKKIFLFLILSFLALACTRENTSSFRGKWQSEQMTITPIDSPVTIAIIVALEIFSSEDGAPACETVEYRMSFPDGSVTVEIVAQTILQGRMFYSGDAAVVEYDFSTLEINMTNVDVKNAAGCSDERICQIKREWVNETMSLLREGVFSIYDKETKLLPENKNLSYFNSAILSENITLKK